MNVRISRSTSMLRSSDSRAQPGAAAGFHRVWLALALLTAMLAVGVSTGTSAAEADQGEVWVTSQGTDRIFILHGQHAERDVETVQLAAGTGPHIITFSPGGEFAYVSGMANGSLAILHADDRRLVATLELGDAGTHQAKPSPDGSVLLVAQIGTKSLIKMEDDGVQSWTVVDSLSFAADEKAPICTVFRDDGQRAYVSLLPSGIAIVDVPTMTVLGTLATDGFVACGMVKSNNGSAITVASSGGGGHFYRLDTATDTLVTLGAIGAPHWHSLNVSPNGDVGYGTSPESDELILVDLREEAVALIAPLPLDPTPGLGNDQPDAVAVRGNTVYVSLRASGKLAIVEAKQQTVIYVDLSPPASFNPANCAGCALHGVAVRA